MTSRLLTVEEFGDAFQARVLPPTRQPNPAQGPVAQRSGFPAGSLAKVTLVSPGVLDIRLITESETSEQKIARLQVMQQLDSAVTFVDRAAVEKGRALLAQELLETSPGD